MRYERTFTANHKEDVNSSMFLKRQGRLRDPKQSSICSFISCISLYSLACSFMLERCQQDVLLGKLSLFHRGRRYLPDLQNATATSQLFLPFAFRSVHSKTWNLLQQKWPNRKAIGPSSTMFWTWLLNLHLFFTQGRSSFFLGDVFAFFLLYLLE